MALRRRHHYLCSLDFFVSIMPPSQIATELGDPDSVQDVDDKKMSDDSALFWKVCVLCETYMRV